MSEQNSDTLLQELAELEKQREELEQRLPAHSIRPHQLIELEDIEDLIIEKKAEIKRLNN